MTNPASKKGPRWMNEPELNKGRISVIVPNFNDLVRLDRCLASLEGQALPRDEFEVIVVDNNSPCGIERVRDAVNGRAILCVCSEKGVGPARNAGVACAVTEQLAFIDSDCIAAPNWLENGLKSLSRDDIIGGRVDLSVTQPGQRSGAEAFEQIFAFDNRRYVEKQHFSVTANLFTRKALFQAVGGFCGTVSEDTEWCQRAVTQGYFIAFCESARVSQPARADLGELLTKWQRINRESFALACERPRGRLRWLIRSLALPPSILLHGPCIFLSARLSRFSERLAALGTLVRIRLWGFGDAMRLGWQGPSRHAR